MIKEVAFVAIAVSDAERARKFYQETLEVKPSTTAMEGAWVEYDLGTMTIGVGCHSSFQSCLFLSIRTRDLWCRELPEARARFTPASASNTGRRSLQVSPRVKA